MSATWAPPRLIRSDLTLEPEVLILRVLLGPAHVEALAPVGIGIRVDDLAVLGVTLEPVGWPRSEALLSFGCVRGPHHESGRRQQLLGGARFRAADRRAPRQHHRRGKRD